MSNCQAITQNNTICSRNALKSGYCAQHDKDQKIAMYRKELAKMHQRVRRYIEISNDLKSKIDDIQRLDYIKSELTKLCPDRPFRAILDNVHFRDQIEKLFGVSMVEAQDEYDQLLTRRNGLVHPFTINGWNCKKRVLFRKSTFGEIFPRGQSRFWKIFLKTCSKPRISNNAFYLAKVARYRHYFSKTAFYFKIMQSIGNFTTVFPDPDKYFWKHAPNRELRKVRSILLINVAFIMIAVI